jgi:hypothetical protein
VLAWLRLVVTLMTYVLAMLAMYVVIRQGVVWGTHTWNDLRYDFPRTTQVSGVVGHNDSVAPTTTPNPTITPALWVNFR